MSQPRKIFPLRVPLHPLSFPRISTAGRSIGLTPSSSIASNCGREIPAIPNSSPPARKSQPGSARSTTAISSTRGERCSCTQRKDFNNVGRSAAICRTGARPLQTTFIVTSMFARGEIPEKNASDLMCSTGRGKFHSPTISSRHCSRGVGFRSRLK